jgi:hypothetical protein
MAADAVLFHHSLAGLQNHDYLGFRPHRKNGSMAYAVFGFKIVLIELIVMGDMAVIAMGGFTMGAVAPGRVLRGHDMTVHTRFGLIGKVGSGTRYIKEIDQDAGDQANGN